MELIGALEVATPEGVRRLAAASGVVMVGDSLVVVADDELHLGVFPHGGRERGRLIRIFGGDLPENPSARKRVKPDLEALAVLPDGALLLVPSGSRPNRSAGALVTLAKNGSLTAPPRTVDFAPLFAALEKEIGPLNLEGATVLGDQLVLLQRGNHKDAINGIISLDLEAVLATLRAHRPEVGPEGLSPVMRVDLGDVDGVPLTFTDAAAFGDRLLFTASAEATADAYLDGEVRGSIVGLLEADLSPGPQLALGRQKVEGVCVVAQGPGGVEILVVTDADDRATPSTLYRLLLPRDFGG